MKKLLALNGLGLLLTVHLALAQMPSTIGYQGLLSDATGTMVADGTYSLTFKLYDAATAGTLLWTETQTVSTNNGVFSALLGSVNALTLAFDKQYWLGIAVSGGAELSPRIKLAGTPYSLRAKSVESEGAVTSLNSLTSAVTLAAGANVTITPSGNTLTVAATSVGNTLDQAYDQGTAGAGRTITADAGADGGEMARAR